MLATNITICNASAPGINSKKGSSINFFYFADTSISLKLLTQIKKIFFKQEYY